MDKGWCAILYVLEIRNIYFGLTRNEFITCPESIWYLETTFSLTSTVYGYGKSSPRVTFYTKLSGESFLVLIIFTRYFPKISALELNSYCSLELSRRLKFFLMSGLILSAWIERSIIFWLCAAKETVKEKRSLLVFSISMLTQAFRVFVLLF